MERQTDNKQECPDGNVLHRSNNKQEQMQGGVIQERDSGRAAVLDGTVRAGLSNKGDFSAEI